TAAWLRGTPPLFSYDFASGVAVAAGVLGLAGAFAGCRRSLLVLLAAGVLSLWFPISRLGFFGKTLAYPGCILVAFAFLETWRQPAATKLGVLALLGAGVALCHHPFTLAAVVTLVLAGGLATGAARRLLG